MKVTPLIAVIMGALYLATSGAAVQRTSAKRMPTPKAKARSVSPHHPATRAGMGARITPESRRTQAMVRPGMAGAQAMQGMQGMMQQCMAMMQMRMGETPPTPPSSAQILGMGARLGLNPDQVNRLQRMKAEADKEMIRRNAEIRTAEIDLQTMLNEPNPDRTAIEQKVQDIAEMNAELRMAQIGASLDAQAILSPNQQASLRMAMAEMPGMGGQMGAMSASAASGSAEATMGARAGAGARVVWPGNTMRERMSALQRLSGEEFDRVFLDTMRAHHEDALPIFSLATERATHPELGEDAQRNYRSQVAEIGEFTRWLTQTYRVAPTQVQSPSAQQMLDQLEGLEGRDFEVAYMRGMIQHHREAVQMARQAQQKSINPQVKQAAARIIQEQTADINQMQSWLNEWYEIS